MNSDDEPFLRRAIRLAMNGRGAVEPNPMVGCVIVKDGHVIGEGYHERFGGPHAEPNALASCTESPAGATAYVTLEPCCHTNKKTPPCTPRLIEATLARVVIGCLDPNPDVNGKGIAMLREAGIDVEAPALEAEAKQLIAPFIARTQHRWPYVTLKWAESADSKIAGPGGARRQISNPRSWELVHQLRARSDAIMVGINTVLSDDPVLTARGAVAQAARLHTRIVLDSRLRIPVKSRLVETARDGGGHVDVYCTVDGYLAAGAEKVKQLLTAGVHVFNRDADDGRPDRLRLLDVFRDVEGFEDVTHLLVEPGPTLAQSCFDANLCDRLWVIRSPKRVDDATAPSAARIPESFVKTGELDLDGDLVTEYLNRDSRVFFETAKSADLVMQSSL